MDASSQPFGPAKDAGASIDTKDITRQLEAHLKPEAGLHPMDDGLLPGWNVETRESHPRIPLLYGENGKNLYGVEPDAILRTNLTATAPCSRSKAAEPSPTSA